ERERLHGARYTAVAGPPPPDAIPERQRTGARTGTEEHLLAAEAGGGEAQRERRVRYGRQQGYERRTRGRRTAHKLAEEQRNASNGDHRDCVVELDAGDEWKHHRHR